MSDIFEEDVAVEDEQKPRRPIGRRLAFVAGVLVLSLGGLAGGLFLSMGSDGLGRLLAGGGDAEAEAVAEEADLPRLSDHPGYALVNFDDMIVNITAITATGRVTSRFLKLNVGLVYDQDVAGAEKVAGRELFMRDAFQDYLRQLSERDLQGSIGIVNLKTELLRRARAIAESAAPLEILVADMIVQ